MSADLLRIYQYRLLYFGEWTLAINCAQKHKRNDDRDSNDQ
jgi:hypothetical protein